MGCGASSGKQVEDPTKAIDSAPDVKSAPKVEAPETAPDRQRTPSAAYDAAQARGNRPASGTRQPTADGEASGADSRIQSAKAPGPIENARFERIGKKSVVISWDQPPVGADRPDEFRANFTGMKDEDPNTMRSEEWVGTECRCVMYGLKKAYAYNIVIRGVRGMHAGPWTSLFLPPRTAQLSEDEASARIAAGLKGLHTRRQLAAGNVSRYEDPDATAKKEATREARKRRKPRRLRTAADLDDDEAAILIQTLVRRRGGERKAKLKKKEIGAFKSCARRATRDICNGVMWSLFRVPDLFVSVELGTSELNGVVEVVVTKLLKGVTKDMVLSLPMLTEAGGDDAEGATIAEATVAEAAAAEAAVIEAAAAEPGDTAAAATEDTVGDDTRA